MRARRSPTAGGLTPEGGSAQFAWADALELPYEDGEFDAATVGFGARNFGDLGRGIAEMARVVRPGGKVVILEITTPDQAAAVDLLRALVRPHRAGARERSPATSPAYSYLPELGEALPRHPRRWRP